MQQGINPRAPSADICPLKPSFPKIRRTEHSDNNAPTRGHSSDRFAAIQSRAFFWMSTACANRPTSCSSAAMRAVEASDGLSVDLKRDAAFSRNWRFHCVSCAAVMLWRRQSSACEVSMLSAYRTTAALNSGVNLLRFRLVSIGYSFQVDYCYITILV